MFSVDIIIVLVIAIAFFFLSFVRGEYILVRFLLSFYPTTLIFTNLPFVTLNGSITKVVVYAVILIIFFILLSKNMTAGRSYKNSKRTFDAVILSLASVTTLLTIYYHIIPLSSVYSFTLPVERLFTVNVPYGVWLIIPIVALIIANRGHR